MKKDMEHKVMMQVVDLVITIKASKVDSEVGEEERELVGKERIHLVWEREALWCQKPAQALCRLVHARFLHYLPTSLRAQEKLEVHHLKVQEHLEAKEAVNIIETRMLLVLRRMGTV